MFHTPCYDITIDPPRDRIDFVLRGSWTEADAVRFGADLAKVLRALKAGGARAGHHRALMDLRELAILSPEMVERHKAFAMGPGTQAERVAVVAKPGLQMLQSRRIGPEPRYQYFEGIAEAEAWLKAERI